MAAAQEQSVLDRVADLVIPFNSMGAADCQEAFMGYYEGYKNLWDTDPWM